MPQYVIEREIPGAVICHKMILKESLKNHAVS